MTNEILFYSRGTDFGWLSNFERSQQVVDGEKYPTNEHFYQSRKANTDAMQRWIASAPTPYSAMLAGRCLRKKDIVEDWDNIKFDVMLTGLRAKFTDNGPLRIKLIETGDAILHENSSSDMIWGIKGKDMLGKLLMQIREEMKLLPKYVEEIHDGE